MLSNPAKWRHFLPVVRSLERDHGMESRIFALSEMHGMPSERERLRQLGLHASFPLRHPIRSEADRIFQGLRLKRDAGRLLAEAGAGAVILHSDRTLPHNLFIRAARGLGIPSLLLQESLRKDEMMTVPLRSRLTRLAYRRLFGLEFRLHMYGQGGCDSISAWGGSSRAYFERVGARPESIHELGNPAVDDLLDFHAQESERARLCARLRVPPVTRFLTLVTSPLAGMGVLTPSGYLRALKRWAILIDAAAEARPGLAVVVKTHNLEGEDIYRDIFTGPRFHVLGAWDILPLLALSDGVLQFSTTAALEAALLATPVGILDAGKPLDNWGLCEQGVGRGLATPEDLRAFLDEVSDESRRKELGRIGRDNARTRFVANLGEAGARVADHIHALATQCNDLGATA